ncbi:MAG: hypothetical protein K2Y23_19910 [Cyanobacteria bacterium]|nr:hypothetical protein [Cyanobacteriota bacterium]
MDPVVALAALVACSGSQRAGYDPDHWQAVHHQLDAAVGRADVFTVPVEQMEAIRSVMTMVGGTIVHETGAAR